MPGVMKVHSSRAETGALSPTAASNHPISCLGEIKKKKHSAKVKV